MRKIEPPHAPLPDGSMIDIEFLPRRQPQRHTTMQDIFIRAAELLDEDEDQKNDPDAVLWPFHD
jgi:hypothetical protein